VLADLTQDMSESKRRTVTLRDERHGEDARHLRAYLDEDGNLHIDGQDLGPGTAMVSSDGEYEWYQVVAANDVSRVAKLLGAEPGESLLDVLQREWTGDRSYELEEHLRGSGIPMTLFVYSG
jgi:hypothetical protein